jgi:hypothetical protein
MGLIAAGRKTFDIWPNFVRKKVLKHDVYGSTDEHIHPHLQSQQLLAAAFPLINDDDLQTIPRHTSAHHITSPPTLQYNHQKVRQNITRTQDHIAAHTSQKDIVPLSHSVG